MKKLGLLLSLLLALVSLLPALASGPVYDDLPDLGGQEVVIAVENLYPPFQFENPNTGEVMGYDYDMVAEICARINCVPVYENTSFDVQIAAVGEGQYDMGMNGLSIREDREEIVDFSTSYITLEQYLLVRGDEERFASYEEFVGNDELLLGVQQGTSGFFITGDVPEERKVLFTEFGALIAALVSGQIDAVPVDVAGAAGFINTTGEDLMIVGEPISSDNFGLIFPNESELVAPFSAAIESMQADGYLDFLFYKWFLNYDPATGLVYDGLPDLGGQEVVIAVENLYPPFQFEDPTTGEATGYEYDMVAEICARINCVPVYENTSFDVQIAAVGEGQYDMGMNGLSIREDREEVVDFSTSYITLEQYLLVRGDEDRFTSYEEFVANDELLLGVQQGTSGFFITGDVPEERKVLFSEFGALIAALVSGQIDAVPVDVAGAAGFINTTGENLMIVGEPISSDNFGLIFPNESELVAPFSAAIESMQADGYLDFLFYKWFLDFQPAPSE